MNHPDRQPGGRILALDLGARRVGVAVSDELGITAQGLPTLVRTNLREDLARVTRLAEEWGAGMILIGNPLHMSGAEGRQSAWVRQFAEKLEGRSGLPVKLWDERLTTVEAERVLDAGRVTRDKHRMAIDRLAAVILLESYLESPACSAGPEEEAE